jgi:two-component system response regulator AlgR
MSMPPLTVLVVDDEAPARERLLRLIDELRGWSVAGACGTGREALQQVKRLQPAVVLMDIRMPGMSGIEAARHLSAFDAPPAIIFTTAYDQYALEAFESHAVGYLLKPVRQERLESALRHAARLAAPVLRELGAGSGGFAERKHVAVRVHDDLRLIPVADILFFRAEQKYVTVRHTAGEELIEESLKQLADEFADKFVRVHRSLLVAIARIEALERLADGSYQVRLRGAAGSLPVSRRRLSELKERLGRGH